MSTLKALWNDESGAIVSTEIVLVITILGIGMVVGLTTLRNDVVIGGEGDDIITDLFGDDDLKGGPGNDAIHGGPGFDLIYSTMTID